MSDQPSWMNADTASTVTQNPAVQKAAVSAAKNPAVQKAAMKAAKDPTVQKAVINNALGNKDVESGAPASAGRQSEFVAADEDLAQMKKYHLGLRVLFIMSSIMMAAGAVTTWQSGTNMASAFICVYIFFFAILVCCFECGLKVVAQMIAANFGFMYTLVGRFLFMMIIAGMLVRLNSVGKAAIGFIAVSLAAYCYVLFKQPKFEEYLRKKHFYAEKDFEL